VGDEGVVASAELRWEVAPGWQWSVFLDHGRIRLHKNPWTGWEAGNANLRNRYNLAAAGTGLSWSRPGNFHLRLVVAWKLGTNPGQSPVGLDSDSRNDSHRAWVQLVKML
jgi:hemolysin activation/secretion protein